ncbi:MAG: hypothetical protein ABS54_08215 [Hyphomicrobium sp. SCN 65-11]|nr:MAG: hypothetical protein ABS54_08215 [Hyphomicrobium sp. SCN 65-11]
MRDIASPDSAAQAKDVEAVLEQIPTPEGKTRRILEVWNKIDLLEPETREAVVGQAERLAREGQAVAVSAWTGDDSWAIPPPDQAATSATARNNPRIECSIGMASLAPAVRSPQK